MVKNSLDKAHKKIIVPFVDLILGRTMSKKLTVFIVATVALWSNLITGAQWTFISMFYVIGLTYLNHLEKMAEAQKNVQDFRGSENIKVFPETTDNNEYD